MIKQRNNRNIYLLLACSTVICTGALISGRLNKPQVSAYDNWQVPANGFVVNIRPNASSTLPFSSTLSSGSERIVQELETQPEAPLVLEYAAEKDTSVDRESLRLSSTPENQSKSDFDSNVENPYQKTD